MFVVDAAALTSPEHKPLATRTATSGSAQSLDGLPARLLAAIAAQCSLLRRQRALPRPAGCGWLPRRAWRRHSALICLRAGIDPDAAAEDRPR